MFALSRLFTSHVVGYETTEVTARRLAVSEDVDTIPTELVTVLTIFLQEATVIVLILFYCVNEKSNF